MTRRFKIAETIVRHVVLHPWTATDHFPLLFRNKNCRTSASDVESDEENEEGDYTVYECPGLAANLGEIEITNPNFQHENVDTPTGEEKAKK